MTDFLGARSWFDRGNGGSFDLCNNRVMVGRIAEPIVGDTESRADRFLSCTMPFGRPCPVLPLAEAPTTDRGFSPTDLTAPA